MSERMHREPSKFSADELSIGDEIVVAGLVHEVMSVGEPGKQCLVRTDRGAFSKDGLSSGIDDGSVEVRD